MNVSPRIVSAIAFACAVGGALTIAARAGAAEPASSSTPDLKESPSCKYCGMDRAKFASTRMLVEYEDGTKLGVCSLHCAAVDLAIQIDKTPKSILVGDTNTRELIDAEKAIWVVGGKKQGVMTKRGKWAFAQKPAAEAFVKENGGAIVGFEEAIRAAYEDMYQDNRMIREKRKARAAQPAAHHGH